MLSLFFGCSAARSATILWTNTVGGNWNDATSWSPNQVPGASDEADITTGGTYSVTLNSSLTVGILMLGGSSGQQTLITGNNTLTLTSGSVVNANGIFQLSGGNITGNLNVYGQFNWTGGQIGPEALGVGVTVETNAVLVLAGANGTDYAVGGSLVNGGTIQLQGGNLQINYCGSDNGTMNNLPGGLVDIQADVSIDGSCGGPGLNNQGTVRKSGGTGTSFINASFSNSGSLDVQTGMVTVNGGGSGNGIFKPESGATLAFGNNYEVDSSLTGPGTNFLSGGTFILNGSMNGTNNVLGGAILSGIGTINGMLTWTNGQFGYSQLAMSIATNGVLVLAGVNGTDYFLGQTLNNAGTIYLQSGNMEINWQTYWGNLVNQPGGLVNFQADVSIDTYGNQLGFVNQGTVRKSGGTGTSGINSIFSNTGTLDVQSGTVNVHGGGIGNGVFQTEAGATLGFSSTSYEVDSALTGAGTNLLTAGNLTLNGSINTSNTVLAGATLTGNVAINSAFEWTSGVLGAANAGISVATNAVLVLAGVNGTDYIMGEYLTNAGTIYLQSGNFQINWQTYWGNLINLPGGIVNMAADVSIDSYGNLLGFINQGTVRKSGGTGTSGINPIFKNFGTVDVQTGTVSVNGGGNGIGTFNAEAGATLMYPASYEVDGSFTGAGTNLITAGATLTGNNVVTGTLTLSGDNYLETVTTIATNGVLNVMSDVARWPGLVLTNYGTINQTNSSIYGGDGTQIYNCGLWNEQSDDYFYGEGYGSPATVIDNFGIFRKSPGTNTTTLDANTVFNNTGTLDVQSGTVDVNGGGTSSGSGTFNTANGGAIIFGGSAGYTFASGGNFTGTGNVVFASGAILINGLAVGSNLHLTGGVLSGTNVLAGTLTASGDNYLESVTTIATNGVLNVANDTARWPGLVLTNYGTINQTNSSIYGGDGTQIYNYGLWNEQSDDYFYGEGYGSPATVFDNFGTFRKSSGTNTTTLDANTVFNNTGTVDAQSGVISLANYFLTGGRLNFGISSLTNYGVISLSGNPATLDGSMSANLNNGYYPVAGNSYGVLAYSSQAGAFTNFVLPSSQAWSTNYGATVFTLSVLNSAPILPGQTNVTVNELTTLTVTNTATDFDVPANTLDYSLPGAPAGAGVSAAGVITWTPAQTESPATNTITTVVTDSGVPSLSATNSFTVVVKEVNVAPTLPAIAQTNVNELALLTVTNTATNANIHSVITGYGLVNPPAGMVIDTNGVITWTPGQTQSPATNVITTVVTNFNPYDLINPSLTSTNSFKVIVKEVNLAPTLPTIAQATVKELTLLTVTNAATNGNIHSVTTGYALVSPPAGMVISASGIITWTPSQTESPGTNVITTIVTNSNPYDLASPQLTATNSFKVVVQEVNVAPVLPVIAPTNVAELTLLTVTNTATDSNIHATVGYSLLNAPAGVSIDASGVITWTPGQGQSPGTNMITTVATSTDNFDPLNPQLSTTNSFKVVVREVNTAPVLPVIAPTNVAELTLLTVTNTAMNSNIHSVITGYGLVNPPAGMAIDANGVITWTPGQSQSPGTNFITTVVTNSNPYDMASPQLTATNMITVVVQEVNTAPVLPVIAPVNVAELTLLTVTNAATNGNIHSVITGYGLVNPPAGMAIDANGIITWTPSQAESPGAYVITTVVTNSNPYDLVNPQLTATNTLTVNVTEINVAPTLPSVATTNVNELSLLTVTNTATNANIHATITAYELLYPLPGMRISPNGVITWRPGQNQSPGTNVITTVAYNYDAFDLVNTQLTSTNSFDVIVNEVNVAPSLPAIGVTNVNELALLTVADTATNANIHSTVTGYALVNPPAGMSINSSGIITWTPGQAQSPSTNSITAIVTNSNPYDLVNPQLTATNNFTVIVNESNVAPVLPAVAATNVNELAVLTVTNTASEPNIHSTITGYGLVSPPAGMVISTNGVITWTPVQAQSPGTNNIITVVTNSDPLDTVNPQLTATNNFTVFVKEVNTAPVLPAIPTQTVNAQALLTVTNTATNGNIHSIITGYGLVSPPAGMSINSSGIISWTPGQAQGSSTNTVTTVVTNANPYDLINPQLTATNSFTVVVQAAAQPTNGGPVLFAATYLGAGGANLSGTGVKYFGGALYICGNNSISSGIIARYNTPLEPGAAPVWDNTWPDSQYRDQFFGITASSSGIYAAGPDYTRTTDTVGGKEVKGLVLKYPFTGATGSGYGGDIWDQQTPAPPGAYSYYGGGESLNALTLVPENGSNYVYTTGSGQPAGYINGSFFISKLAEDSTVLWTQTQATPGTDNSYGRTIVALNTNVYIGGYYSSASQLLYPVLWKYSSSGSLVWQRNGSSPAYFNGITTLSNNIYVVGGNGVGGSDLYGGPGQSDFLVEKWDQNGNQIWSRIYTNSVQSLLSAVVNVSNRLFAVGYTYAGTGGNAEAVLMEINPATGDQISSTTFAGASVSMATGIDSDGTNLFVVGSSASSGNVANQIMLLRYSIPAAVPDITNQPQSLTVFAGTTTNISVGAAGPAPIGYQWYYNNNTALPNATNATLSFAPAITNQTGSYFAVVSNAYGAVTSSVVTLTVYAQNPLITSQPKGQTLAIGSTARFTASVTGVPPLTYQWYFNNALYAGATNATLAVGPVLSSHAGNYQIVVTNLYGSTTSVVASLSVLLQPNIYGVSNVSNGAAGPKLLLLASLPGSTNLLWASTNLSLPISQWQLIGTVTAGTNGLFQFIDTNTAGISHKFYTMSSFLTPSLPSVTISPQNPTVVIGGAASFNSTVGGTPPFSYQWYFNNAPANGATNTLLAFNPVAANEAGNYQLVVTNSFGSATSAVDQLTVLLQPNLYGFSLGTNRVFTLDLASAPGTSSRVWASTNLINWQVLATNIPDATGLFQFMDTNTQGSKVKFYRLSAP